jgi:hypothetical protein
MPGLMSGDWKRSTVSGPQRLQPSAWTAPDLLGRRASPRRYPEMVDDFPELLGAWTNDPVKQTPGTPDEAIAALPSLKSIAACLISGGYDADPLHSSRTMWRRWSG